MKAEDRSFYFLATPSYYDIPFFQRAYVWDEENWSELFVNLTNRRQNHFLGSIILKNESVMAGSVARYAVIDGQQRLTTLSILLRACYDHIVKHAEQYGLNTDAIKTCEINMQNLLFVPEGGIKRKLIVKINHSRLDKKAYESVINGELDKEDRWEKYVNTPEDEITSSIIKAYAYFRDRLAETDQETIDYLWELLTVDKIKFLVNIGLDADDNEQAIFDTVNSAGVRLSSADTIKNLLFQRYVELLRADDLSSAEERAVSEYDATWVDAFVSDESVNAYWEAQRQYGRMKRSNLETFLHSFAVVEGFFNPAENNMSELPQEYRKKVARMDISQIESFLTEMHDYAGVFRDYFSDGDYPLSFDNYIGRVLNICNVLEVSTFYPFFLQQLYLRNKGLISEYEIKQYFFDLEKYVVLNAICKGSTKNYNNECVQLVEKKKKPIEIFISSVDISEGNFVNGLRRMTSNKLPTLLLFWIELYQRNQLNVDVKGLKYGYTLEHIMPQKWAQNWSSVTAYDPEHNVVKEPEAIERVRNHAIYELGNMTLLNSKLNTSISNGTFYDKVNGKADRKGIKNLADLRLTREVVDNHSKWDERDIYKRTAELEQQIRIIWEAENLPTETSARKSIAEGGRKKIRLAFWEMALPIIREKNNYECYSNVNPSTDNYLSGTFGMGGFSVICTANYENARVDFAINKKDSAENKMVFDMLFEHKTEVEEALGVRLEWDRADELKGSWISYTLHNVSVTDEKCWESMAGFLGEWSSKLRHAFIPYLLTKYTQDLSGTRTPEEIKKLLQVAEIVNEWVSNKSDVVTPGKSTRSFIRFTSKKMSELMPDLQNAPSGWSTENHYYYEIVNQNVNYLVIQLIFSSRNMTEDQKELCKKMSDYLEMKLKKDDWQWWTAYKTSKIMIPDDLNNEAIFKSLDAALLEILNFEKTLIEYLVSKSE